MNSPHVSSSTASNFSFQPSEPTTCVDQALRIARCSYVWRINNIFDKCKRHGERIESPLFSINDTHWQLRLYPRGVVDEKKEYMALYLKSCNEASVSVNHVHYIINDKNERFVSMDCGTTKFGKAGSTLGESKFVKIQDVVENCSNLLTGDCLTILSEITMDMDVYGDDVARHDGQCYTKFERFLNSRELSDVTFLVKGQEVYAHKFILAACSDTFARTFREVEHEKSDNPFQSYVLVDDLDYEVFLEICRFLYTGKINDLDSMKRTYLMAANKFGLDELKVVCERRFVDDLTIYNAIEYLQLADLHDAQNLKSSIVNFIGDNAREMVVMPEFEALLALRRGLVIEVIQKIVLG